MDGSVAVRAMQQKVQKKGEAADIVKQSVVAFVSSFLGWRILIAWLVLKIKMIALLNQKVPALLI